jgi:transcription termination factor Rho
MELHLDRRLAERGVYPAIDINRSGTRRDDLLMDSETIRQVQLLKRMMSLISADATNTVETTERVLERLRKTQTNAEFLAKLTNEK